VVSAESDISPTDNQPQALYDALKAPKALMKFTSEQSAEAHCQMGAIAISNERIFDWLGDVFNFK